MVDLNTIVGSGVLAGLAGFFAAFIILAILILVALYVYLSFAFMAIAKKRKLSSPWLAWIPGFGPLIISYRISKMHWWPWLMLIGFAIPFVGIICAIIFSVYAIIWMWKTFQAMHRPGWWALVSIGAMIPFIGFVFGIVYLVLIGVAAWGKK